MLKLGFLRLLAGLTFGLAIPYGFYRLSRVAGLQLTMLGAIALGLAYGAIKADNAWSGRGLESNLALMATSAVALATYVGVSVFVARAVARRL